MDNLEIYNKYRNPPKDAIKPITAGRLKGKSDINPMWRIKALTEAFGMCGIGWYYKIANKWTEQSGDEIAAFVDIELYVIVDGKESAPILGTGGSMLRVREKSGMYTDDDAFKKATTDAISVACKQLGFAADIYWNTDRSKYDRGEEAPAEQKPAYPPREEMLKVIYAKYPRDSKHYTALIAAIEVDDIENATDEKLMAVYNKATAKK